MCMKENSSISLLEASINTRQVSRYLYFYECCKSYVYSVAQSCDRNETTRKDSAGAILYAAEKSTQITLELYKY